jgi:hypothetical protein
MRGAALLQPVTPLILVALLVASAPGTAGGFAGSDARTSELQRDLRTLRADVERAPRLSSFALRNLQRRVREQRIEDPRDPRLQELALELDQLRARDDRAARRAIGWVPGLRPSSSPRRASAPIDARGYSRGTAAPAASPPARPYLGQRVVAMQKTAAEIEQRLDRGDTAAAARLLEAIETDLATLQTVFGSVVAEDPNMVALEEQIRALEHRLEAD